MAPWFALAFVSTTTLIRGGTVVDGSGGPARIADVLIEGDRIRAIGKIRPVPGQVVIDAKGLVVAPGFIDAHSHADGGVGDHPDAISQITQGITTSVVGQDGAWKEPLTQFFMSLAAAKPALNYAAFTGHGGIRAQVMGEDYKRTATPEEIEKMQLLVDADMKAGALGLSSGLEYDPGYYSNTDELVALAKVAARYKGMYISHVRDEANVAFKAFDELLQIHKEAGLRAQISHIKLCSATVWGQSAEACALLKGGVTADVYPYTFWQSTMAALTPSREWEKRDIWVKALDDVGGPANVRLTAYTHEPTWVGKNLAEIAKITGRDPIEIMQEVLRKTRGPGGSGEESVAVTAMSESDVETFVKNPNIMFSSDGSIGGSHPRSAGSFPRVLGYYVRTKKALPLTAAIRKMTSLPAKTFNLKDRGMIAKGAIADVVVFDPKTISDKATASKPTTLSVGMKYVYVSGVPTLAAGKMTGRRNGKIVPRGK